MLYRDCPPEQIQEAMELLYEMGYAEDDIYTPLTTGWSDDNTAYVSLNGSIDFWVYGDRQAEQYRCAAFYRKESGEILEEHGFIMMQELGEGEYSSYFEMRLSDMPGVYEDIALAFSCGEEVWTHTFDLVITEDVQRQIDSVTEAAADPKFLENGYGFYGSEAPTLYCDSVYTMPGAISPGEIVIEYPLEGKVMTGFDGVSGFRYDLSAAIGKTEGGAPPYFTDCGEFWECNVLYSIEEQPFVFPSVWNPGEYRLTYDFGEAGLQSVSIILEKKKVCLRQCMMSCVRRSCALCSCGIRRIMNGLVTGTTAIRNMRPMKTASSLSMPPA